MAAPADPGGAAAQPRAPLPRVLWPLLFGNFVIGAGIMVVPGTLNEISSSLQVTVAGAGQLITVGGVVMCLGAESSSKLARSLDRKTRLLTVGDAFKPRKVTEAMAEGAAAALTL